MQDNGITAYDFNAALVSIAATASDELKVWMRSEYKLFQEGQAAGKEYVAERVTEPERQSYFERLWVMNEKAFCERMRNKLNQ